MSLSQIFQKRNSSFTHTQNGVVTLVIVTHLYHLPVLLCVVSRPEDVGTSGHATTLVRLLQETRGRHCAIRPQCLVVLFAEAGQLLQRGDDESDGSLLGPGVSHFFLVQSEGLAQGNKGGEGSRDGRQGGRQEGRYKGRYKGRKAGREGRDGGRQGGKAGRKAGREGREGRQGGRQGGKAGREGREGRQGGKAGREGREEGRNEGREEGREEGRDHSVELLTWLKNS